MDPKLSQNGAQMRVRKRLGALNWGSESDLGRESLLQGPRIAFGTSFGTILGPEMEAQRLQNGGKNRLKNVYRFQSGFEA